MEDIYENIEFKARSTSQRGPRSSQRRCHRAVYWFLLPLSFFFLAGIIGLFIYCHDLARHSSAIEANLTEHLQDRENQLSSLTEQRDLLNATLTEMTEELQRLQCLVNQTRTCPAGWMSFIGSCYLFSDRTKTWQDSRQDCRVRGADLVVVDSFGEQEFITDNIVSHTWIGLSDSDNEGIWKWTDGTALTQAYWVRGEPNNDGGNPGIDEDCGHLYDLSLINIKEENWNDDRCDATKRWICEKNSSSY
uniref:CD209 antigen-like protein C n=1 Tax=Labrus bergylta TaxID=56723 RepID=A0A3Q3LZF1_9LABR|nr:CD209 antigen-like protein C [Labrus bergylta]